MARPQRWRTMFERYAVTPGGRLRIILCERHAVARLSTPAQGIAKNTTRTLLGIAAGMGVAASAAGGGPLNTKTDTLSARPQSAVGRTCALPSPARQRREPRAAVQGHPVLAPIARHRIERSARRSDVPMRWPRDLPAAAGALLVR